MALQDAGVTDHNLVITPSLEPLLSSGINIAFVVMHQPNNQPTIKSVQLRQNWILNPASVIDRMRPTQLSEILSSYHAKMRPGSRVPCQTCECRVKQTKSKTYKR